MRSNGLVRHAWRFALVVVVGGGLAEQVLGTELVNSRLAVVSRTQTYSKTPVPGGPAGTITFTMTLRNVAAEPLVNLFFKVAILTNGNLLVNADGGPGGVGAVLTPTGAKGTFDGELSSGETFSATFVIGLGNLNRFNFYINTHGTILLGKATIGPEGGSVADATGSSIAIPPGALLENIVVSISASDPIDSQSLPQTDLSVVGFLKVDLGGQVLTTPAEISIPAPPSLSEGSELLVAVTATGFGPVAVGAQDPAPPQTTFIDTALVQGGFITTQQPGFPGVLLGGIYWFFLSSTPFGFVDGQVTEAGSPVMGAVVTISRTILLVRSDNGGRYRIPAPLGLSTVHAFNPVSASSDTASTFLLLPGNTNITNLTLIPSATVPVGTGIRNAGFESTNLQGTGWSIIGDAQVVERLGNNVITPYRGRRMALISSGDAAFGGASTGLRHSFTVPARAKTLSLLFNFVSEEYPEFIGTQFNDTFHASLMDVQGAVIPLAYADVNSATLKCSPCDKQFGPGSFVNITGQGINFPGGDNTVGMTDWIKATADVSSYAATGETLTITVTDAGDTIYDTVVLLDALTFHTVDLDVKVVTGTNAPVISDDEVWRDIEAANDVWRACGIFFNVNGNRFTPVSNSALEILHDDTEKQQLLSTNMVSGSINVYYVRDLKYNCTCTPTSGCINCATAFTNRLGGCCIVMTLNKEPGTLAHELGHALWLDHHGGELRDLDGDGDVDDADHTVLRNQSGDNIMFYSTDRTNNFVIDSQCGIIHNNNSNYVK